MKVLEIKRITGEYVSTDDGEYIRYDEDNWVWVIGESTEAVYDSEVLEGAYQAYIMIAKRNPPETGVA